MKFVTSIKENFIKNTKSVVIGLTTAVLAFTPLAVLAATAPNQPVGKVSFTFDDGLLSALTNAAPTLSKYGFTGTEYVTTNCIGSVNSCDADPAATYMNWTQVKQLKNTYGWEIGAHMYKHIPISTMSTTRLNQDINKANQAFATQGITPTAFASPEGDYSPSSLGILAKYYTSHRGFHDTGYNSYPYNDYILRVQQVQIPVSVETVKSYINTAKANNQWLILVFHDIQNTPDQSPDEYEYATADLDKIAAYVKQQNIPVTNVSQGLVSSQDNMLANGSFNAGISQGWSTDNSSAIKLNNQNQGSVPSPVNSAQLTATTKNAHLFSPTVNVNPEDSYVIKNYIKITRRSANDISFLIDEYDNFGNWVSTQYKGSISWLYPEEKTYVYKPTNLNVRKARIQVVLPGGSGITAYIDNYQMFSISGNVVAPPSSTSNLMPNSWFDSGISEGWTVDSVNITPDSTGKGSQPSPITSVKFNSSTSNIHLFSPKISTDISKQYQIKFYLDIATRTSGVVGFYIDEYDANGNWISGQYKFERADIAASNGNFTYTPSTSNVKKSSLQVIVSGNSGITAFLDSVEWLSQQ